MSTNYCYSSNVGTVRVGGSACSGSYAGLANFQSNIKYGQEYPGFRIVLPLVGFSDSPRLEKVTQQEAIKDLYHASRMGDKIYK